MIKMIEGMEHYPGAHCCSTALADVARYYGADLSEAMCFGLASGLGFFYMKDDQAAIPRMFLGRSQWVVPVFFANIGSPFEWQPRPDFPWAELKGAVDRNQPAILLTDLYYLDYYQTSTHFSGHCVVLAGYDEERQVVYLGDTERPGWQETSISSLQRAMVSVAAPNVIQNMYRVVSEVNIGSLEEAVERALKHNARSLLEPGDQRQGLQALLELAGDIKNWPAEVPNWQWCARFGYQAIEKRGTGGGNFRFIYGQYLEEAARLKPWLAEINAAKRMKELARIWTGVAGLLKEISEKGDRGLLQKVAEDLQELYLKETALWREIAGRV